MNGDTRGAGIGALINLIGSITMLTSHSQVARAGEEIIKAGEELEKEISIEINKTEQDDR